MLPSEDGTMQVQPYLDFDGRCDEALAFYERAVGAVSAGIMRWRESPEADKTPPGAGDKILHAEFRIGETLLFASDGHCQNRPSFNGIMLTITVSSEGEADRVFGGLSDGGEILMPMGKTFFSPRFGMTKDRFGVTWIVLVPNVRK
jgi:PhnB protein